MFSRAKLKKLTQILARPGLWSSLAHGTAPGVEHLRVLEMVQIGTCLDVGANCGQFSVLVKYRFPDADIFAFEPQAQAADQFAAVVKGGNIRINRCALGSENGQRTLYVTARGDSSSLFVPIEGPARLAGIYQDHAETVDVKAMDGLIAISECKPPVFMKVDVQGTELDVLKGCGAELRFIDWIYVELSFVALYEKQPLASEVVHYLNDQGFELRGVFNQTELQGYGVAQADFLFERRSRSARSIEIEQSVLGRIQRDV